jgi:hypothetical protein
LLLGDNPMLDPHVSAPSQRVRKPGDVAGREDAGGARLHESVDQDTVIRAQARLNGNSRPGSHADAHDDDVGIQPRRVVENHLLLVDGYGFAAEMEDDTMCLMFLPHEVAEVGSKHTFQRSRARGHDVNLKTPLDKRSCNLKADDTRPDDNGNLTGVGFANNRAAVGKRAERQDVPAVGARYGQAHRFGRARGISARES